MLSKLRPCEGIRIKTLTRATGLGVISKPMISAVKPLNESWGAFAFL